MWAYEIEAVLVGHPTIQLLYDESMSQQVRDDWISNSRRCPTPATSLYLMVMQQIPFVRSGLTLDG